MLILEDLVMTTIKTLFLLSLFFLVGCKNLTLGHRGDYLYVVAPAIYKNDPMFANAVALNQPFEIRVGVLLGEQSQLRGKEIEMVAYSTPSCTTSDNPISALSEIATLPLDARLKFTIQGTEQAAGKSFMFKPQQVNSDVFESTITVEPVAEQDTCLIFKAYDAALTTIGDFNRAQVNRTRVFTSGGSN
jgi:hypothetical protein